MLRFDSVKEAKDHVNRVLNDVVEIMNSAHSLSAQPHYWDRNKEPSQLERREMEEIMYSFSAFGEIISAIRGPDLDNDETELKNETTAKLRDAIGLTSESGLNVDYHQSFNWEKAACIYEKVGIPLNHFKVHFTRAAKAIKFLRGITLGGNLHKMRYFMQAVTPKERGYRYKVDADSIKLVLD